MVVWQVGVRDFAALPATILFDPSFYFNDCAAGEIFPSPTSSTGNICFLLARS